ncbi:MAG: hypothetical protein QF612_05500 [Candidatus Thalassarchaeaceae archaeon]|jgi:hypothetical protein|nr:hypothetical protein [Candidatus Poseidoniaceae archaeon]MDP7329281.1 hypothetical protein [Candidatus Thalassarchaeaceae archaeon]|tara:strand:+ start:1201 stop:1332 length:132 start_codon:yes stop_codon:yes gene_type:complete
MPTFGDFTQWKLLVEACWMDTYTIITITGAVVHSDANDARQIR